MANLISPLKPAKEARREAASTKWRRQLLHDLILGYSLVLAVALLACVLWFLIRVDPKLYLSYLMTQ